MSFDVLDFNMMRVDDNSVDKEKETIIVYADNSVFLYDNNSVNKEKEKDAEG